jgi:hypothetical protein
MERVLRPDVVPSRHSNEPGWVDPIYSEVIYETQSPFVVPERTCDRGVLEAAVDIAQRALGLVEHGAVHIGLELELDAEHASGRPVQSVNDYAARFVQQQWDGVAAAG